jgi:hypothetical protein
MMKANHITVELKEVTKGDGTLPLAIINFGTEQGLSPEHAARVFGITDIKLRRIITSEKIETGRVAASGLKALREAGVIGPKSATCRFISRVALYRIAKAIGTKDAMEAFASIWRAGRPFNSLKDLGKVITQKSLLAECIRRLHEQEQRIATLEEQVEKLIDFLMDNVTIEMTTQEDVTV